MTVMLSTIKGIYNNGQLVLEEAPEVSGPVEVLVTFTQESEHSVSNKKTVFGFAKGTVLYMAPDFDEPLEDLKDYM
jgi:hypothetical protein